MPFLVRKGSDETYRLVGPCYVKGISNGERAASARRGNRGRGYTPLLSKLGR